MIHSSCFFPQGFVQLMLVWVPVVWDSILGVPHSNPTPFILENPMTPNHTAPNHQFTITPWKIKGWNLRIQGDPWNRKIIDPKPSFSGSMFNLWECSWFVVYFNFDLCRAKEFGVTDRHYTLEGDVSVGRSCNIASQLIPPYITQLTHTPEISNSRPYLGKPMVNKPLIKPDF